MIKLPPLMQLPAPPLSAEMCRAADILDEMVKQVHDIIGISDLSLHGTRATRTTFELPDSRYRNPLLDGPPHTYMGLKIVQDLSEYVEDWSGVRSHSRARRRLKRGHKQNIKLVKREDALLEGGKLHVTPVMYREIYKRFRDDAGSII